MDDWTKIGFSEGGIINFIEIQKEIISVVQTNIESDLSVEIIDIFYDRIVIGSNNIYIRSYICIRKEYAEELFSFFYDVII